MDQPTIIPTDFPDYGTINRVKADFDSIYNNPDPRSYYRVLGGLDYVVPGLAAPILRQLIAARAATQDRPVTVLDLGCSYGTTSLLLRFPLTFDQVRRRYMNPAMQTLESDAIQKLDRAYFRSWPREGSYRIIGLDPSESAVRYATDVGILDFGIDEDLERNAPSSRARIALSEVDIVISTGCVGYVSERTFDILMDLNRNRRAPWVASFVLRMFPYDSIEETLRARGLVTEKFEGATFVQRRFHSVEEYEQTLETLEQRGIDPAGREADGLYHAELFVSRPGTEIAAAPVNRLISIVSGQRERFGRRFHRIDGLGATELLIN